ncbi:hypothetical protein FGB62_24g014 [Gracilaria domingensis]|nr:hypothetical protein FGB62_24g014 [Gracilaria domingensis]
MAPTASPSAASAPPQSAAVMPAPASTAHSRANAVPYPPQTPPMIDPSNLRYLRMTPNLRDMVSGLSQPTPDPTAHMNDLLASPDPAPFYNSLTFASPILRDLYPSPNATASTALHTVSTPSSSEPPDHRLRRIAGARAQMNALFHSFTPTNADTENGSDSNNDGVISLMSTPDMRQASQLPLTDPSTPFLRSKPEPDTNNSRSNSQPRESQSSSVTPPPDTSVLSPTTSPEITSKLQPVNPVKEPRSLSTNAPSSIESESKPPVHKPKPVSVAPRKPQTSAPQTNKTSSTVMSSALAAPHSHALQPNALSVNPAMAGLIPYACPIPPQMLANAVSAQYQGRPVAYLPGASPNDLLQYNMLAQATAFHLGTAQAMQAAGRALQQTGMSPTTPLSNRPEPMSGSRKKKRRQMLERSGCSVEQARENRARALKRLRHKKSMRTQGTSVRYACRKRIAMVRPRVNGRFATKEEVEDRRRAQQ